MGHGNTSQAVRRRKVERLARHDAYRHRERSAALPLDRSYQ